MLATESCWCGLQVGHKGIHVTPEPVRFWRFVLKGPGCWAWMGCRDKRGYGRFGLRSRDIVLAHRFSWQVTFGDPGPLCVLHRCDNPPCVNPEHLFLGTVDDNNLDRDRKGRVFQGERHNLSTIPDATVVAIRVKYAAGGTSHRRLAREYGIHRHTVYRILNYQTRRQAH